MESTRNKEPIARPVKSQASAFDKALGTRQIVANDQASWLQNLQRQCKNTSPNTFVTPKKLDVSI